jgi:hypothetical protein
MKQIFDYKSLIFHKKIKIISYLNSRMEKVLKILEENQAQNKATINSQSVLIFDKRQDAESTFRTKDSF